MSKYIFHKGYFKKNACIGLKTVYMREDLEENRFAIWIP